MSGTIVSAYNDICAIDIECVAIQDSIERIHSKYYLDYNTDKNVMYLDGPKQINRERMSSMMLL